MESDRVLLSFGKVSSDALRPIKPHRWLECPMELFLVHSSCAELYRSPPSSLGFIIYRRYPLSVAEFCSAQSSSTKQRQARLNFNSCTESLKALLSYTLSIHWLAESFLDFLNLGFLKTVDFALKIIYGKFTGEIYSLSENFTKRRS